MRKFIIDKQFDNNEHWKYCEEHDIPYIKIHPATKFSRIEFDVYTMFGFHQPTANPSDLILEIYKSYYTFFKLPKDKISCAGGSNNLIFTVFKEHAEFIATQLFDFINEFVKNNRKSL